MADPNLLMVLEGEDEYVELPMVMIDEGPMDLPIIQIAEKGEKGDPGDGTGLVVLDGGNF